MHEAADIGANRHYALYIERDTHPRNLTQPKAPWSYIILVVHERGAIDVTYGQQTFSAFKLWNCFFFANVLRLPEGLEPTEARPKGGREVGRGSRACCHGIVFLSQTFYGFPRDSSRPKPDRREGERSGEGPELFAMELQCSVFLSQTFYGFPRDSSRPKPDRREGERSGEGSELLAMYDNVHPK
ncbi:hypothetical protein DFH06DRAFT_1121584 [Mycena polygramma]|nr:hypothetical protein DFH06DRAFT_1121584 [Mycena polygramma]